jgi:hypothetical protein
MSRKIRAGAGNAVNTRRVKDQAIEHGRSKAWIDTLD